MTTQQPMGTDLKEVLRLGREGLPATTAGADWVSPVRERAAAEFLELPLPERRLETWRYTPVSFLDKTGYQPAVAASFDALQHADIEDLLLPEQPGPRLVFVNGYFAPHLSLASSEVGGVLLSTLSGGLGEVPAVLRSQLDRIAEHRHAFAALNSALMSDGALIHVPRDHSAELPIEVLHISVGTDKPLITHPRHLVVLESGARIRLVERYVSLGDAVYFNNALVEIALGVGSELVHERLQEESAQAQHLTDLHIRFDEGSRYRQVLAALGGSWSRNDIQATFAGEGAVAEFDGLLLARDGQLNDVHLDVRHEVPACTSRENFRGILDGQGRVVFDGRILVARDAQKTDAMLTNDNLLLSRMAEVDTKPQLEIYADDVKCSHGTTVGELDHDMLFYLRSRGIKEAKAKQMLCVGLAGEVLERLTEGPLRMRAAKLLADRLVESV